MSIALLAMMALGAPLFGVDDLKTIANLATVLGSLAAVAGVLVAIRAINASRKATADQIKGAHDSTTAQITASRNAAAVDVLYRLIDRWQSSGMVGKRKAAASAALHKNEVPEVKDVLRFFEFVGFLVAEKAVRTEGVWVNLSHDAILTWYAYYDPTIKRDRSNDRTFWEDFRKLVDAMADESRRRGEPESECHPDEEAWKRFLAHEEALGVTPGNP